MDGKNLYLNLKTKEEMENIKAKNVLEFWRVEDLKGTEMEGKLIIHGIHTWASYKERREIRIFNYNFFNVMNEIKRVIIVKNKDIEDIEEKYNNYVKSFCKFCTTKPYHLCFRHYSALEFMNLIFRIDNNRDMYSVQINFPTINFNVKIANWDLNMLIDLESLERSKITITRPSARFVFKKHKWVTSFDFILAMILVSYENFKEYMKEKIYEDFGKIEVFDFDEEDLKTLRLFY